MTEPTPPKEPVEIATAEAGAVPRVTVQYLHDMYACSSQVEHFEKKYGSVGVEITVENMVAVAEDFEFDWAGRNLLPPAAEWNVKFVDLEMEYDAALDVSYEMHGFSRSPDETDEQRDARRVRREAANAEARATYLVGTARLFAELAMAHGLKSVDPNEDRDVW
jgi:hypothetical protein